MAPHHRVLRQVIVGPPRNGVELHQVLEVGNLTLYPFLGGRGRQEVSQLDCPALLPTTGPWPCPPASSHSRSLTWVRPEARSISWGERLLR